MVLSSGSRLRFGVIVGLRSRTDVGIIGSELGVAEVAAAMMAEDMLDVLFLRGGLVRVE
jgi:hypothetical protein